MAEPFRLSKRRAPHWSRLAVIAAVAGVGAWTWTFYAAASKTADLVTQPVLRGDIESSVVAAGTLEAISSVNVGTQVSGQLKAVHVEVGETVQQGQLVAEIDPALIEHKIEIDRAEFSRLAAQLVAKKAQRALKQTNIDRQRNLAATRSIAQSSLDQAIADLAAAEADVNAVEAEIRKQRATLAADMVDLDYTKVYAPMSGTIVDIPVKQGQTLNASQTTPTIATIADLSTMTVKARVSEADIGKLSIGMDAYFTLLGKPGKRFPGSLRQILPMPDTENNVVLYNALFDVPNPDGELMISMSAQVFFQEAAAKNVLLVPAVALRSRSDIEAGDNQLRIENAAAEVTVVTSSGALEVRSVEVGIRNRTEAEIRNGLQEDEAVIIDAQHNRD